MPIEDEVRRMLERLLHKGIISGWAVMPDGSIELYVRRSNGQLKSAIDYMSSHNIPVRVREGVEFILV